MRIALAFCLITLTGFTMLGQEGKQFPKLSGETLDSKEVTIPESVTGKITLVGLAYSKKAEQTLSTWYTPMYDKFVLKRGIFDHLYDVNMFFVPMYTGAKKMAYGTSMKKLMESNRKDLFPYILFYKGELDVYAEALNMDNKNLPYFFVLDEEGKIVYATKGLYNEQKMEKIEEILDARL